MKSYCKRVGIPLLILTLLVSVMAPLITLAEDPPPSYETDDWTEFNKLEVADDLHDASQFLSIKYSQGLTFRDDDSPYFAEGDACLFFSDDTVYGLKNEMTWEIRAKAKIALTMYYPWGMTDWAVPKPENMPEFFVSEDRVNWTPVALSRSQRLGCYNNFMILTAHWIDETPEGSRYLKVRFPLEGNVCVAELRQSGGSTDTLYGDVFSDGTDASMMSKAIATSEDVYPKDNDYVGQVEKADIDAEGRTNAIATYWPVENSHSYVTYQIPAGSKVLAEGYIFTEVWKKNDKGLPEVGTLDEKFGDRFFRLSTSADNQTWTVAENTKIAAYAGPSGAADASGNYPIRGWDKVILCLDEMPAGHTYLRIEMPNYKDVAGYEASAWMMFLTSMRAQQLKSAQEETANLARFDALDTVDSFKDVSRLSSVLHKTGYTLRPGGEGEAMFRDNDDVLSFSSAVYKLTNELTWEFSAGQQPVLALYYPKTLLDENGGVPQDKAPAFYTSTDRFNWTPLEMDEVLPLGAYGSQKLVSFWGKSAPAYTKYLKVAFKTGETVYLSELKSQGTADHSSDYAEVFSDPMDTSIRPNGRCDVVFFNDEWGIFSPGQGELKDFRRDDDLMGVMRTYWPEDDQKELWVDYQVPLNSRVTIETYLVDIIWKRNEDGVILPGTLDEACQSQGAFKVYTSADGKTWTQAEAKMAVYPGFGYVDGAYTDRTFDKVVYGIDKMPEGHGMVRICFPNYINAGTVNGVEVAPEEGFTWTWIPSIKAIRAELPVSGLADAEPVAEGDLADLPVIDDCGDLSKAEPSLLENFRVQAPNGVSVGTTDPGDAVLVRQYGDVPSSLSWAIGSRSKVALIAYQHKDTLTGGDASTVKENSRLQLLTGQNRFELDEAQAQVKVLGRVGDSDYYKVAYVIEETRRYDTLLRAVFPVCAKGTDIAVTTLRGTAGSKESDPAWKPGFHDTCEDDSLVYNFEGLAEFVYEEIPRDGVFANDGTVFPDGDLDRVFPTRASMDNAIVWEVAPGSRVTFKLHYMSLMWALDSHGMPKASVLNAEREEAGDEVMPKIYSSADNVVWDEITDFQWEFTPAYYLGSGDLSEHRYDFAYFYVDKLPADARYVIFEFPGQYRNPWEVKLYDVLAEAPAGQPDPDTSKEPSDPSSDVSSDDGPAPDTGVGVQPLALAAAAGASLLLPLLYRRRQKRRG